MVAKREEDSQLEPLVEHILEALDQEAVPEGDAPTGQGLEGEADQELIEAAMAYRAAESALSAQTQVPSAFPPGTVLGDFAIEALLGAGGFGAVYRARQRSLGNREVALKVLPRTGRSREYEDRFRAEALAASSLHHPHLAEVYGFGAQDDYLYYAMRLVEGPTLREVLRRIAGQPDVLSASETRRRIVGRIAEVASALALVHDRGFAHRDVKPGNIMLTMDDPDAFPDCPAVLVDFGLVRPVDSKVRTRPGSRSGTPAYASPELLLGQPVDARSDVFSLGVTLHDLLSGREPQNRDQASAGLEPLRQLAPDIDRDLSAVVGMAADPDAGWRYRDARALHADLESWLAGAPVRARGLRPIERAWRWVRRHPRHVLRGAGLAAALLLVVTGTSWLGAKAARAAEARKAYHQASLLELGDALSAVPSLLAAPLLQEPHLVELHRQLGQEGGSDHPVVRIRELLVSGDMRGALRAAGDHLAEHGFSDAPAELLVEFLRQPLLSQGARPAELRNLAIAEVTTLFHKRPNAKRRDVIHSRPLRAAILGLWIQQQNGLTRIEQLRLLTALSGCGTSEEVGLVLQWVQGQAAACEEQRLGLSCAARIVWRAQACGEALEIRNQAWWPDFASYSRSLWEGHAVGRRPLREPLVRALTELSEALLFSQRRTGERSALQELLPRAYMQAMGAGPKPWSPVGEAPILLAAANDNELVDHMLLPWLDSVLERPESPCEPFNDWTWGRLTGALGRRSLAERVRKTLVLHRGEQAGEEFDNGHTAGRRAVAGMYPSDVAQRWPALVAGSTPRECPVTRRDEPPVEDLASTAIRVAEAQWIFGRNPIWLDGFAEAVRIRNASYGRTDHSYTSIHLRSPEASVIDLDLAVTTPLTAELLLGIVLQRETHRYLPFEGVAYLQIDVDGYQLSGGLHVGRSVLHTIRIEVPPELLTLGDHRINLRLGGQSTGSLRVFKVWLEPAGE